MKIVNVLVVDDEPIVRMGLKTLVDWEIHGFKHAGEAEDGEEAWSQIEALQIDIVITDLVMPRMDGLELICKLETHFRPVAVIALSCMDDFTYVKEAMKHGAKDYILKPTMEPDQLIQILLNVKVDLLRTRETHRQLAFLQQEKPAARFEYWISSSNPFVRKAFRYMENNYARNIGMIDIAEHVRLSRSYLSDLYSKEAGESLSESLTRIRICKAKEMLQTSGLKIYEVAEAVGFLDARVFAKVFKRLEGCTPREFEAQF